MGTTADITVTERAARRIAGYLEAERGGAGVFRLGVRGGGCSGFQYEMLFEDGAAADDLAVEAHGVVVVVDPVSAPFLAGATLDYAESLTAYGFQVENPNVTASCGCGSSFFVDDDLTAAAS